MNIKIKLPIILRTRISSEADTIIPLSLLMLIKGLPMEFKDLEILKSGYQGLHDRIVPMMLRTDETKFRNRIIPSINAVAWLVWHMLRTEDMFLSTVVFSKNQLFHTHDWQSKLGIDTTQVGTGMTIAEADKLAKTINIEALEAYNSNLKEHSLKLLDLSSDWPSNELDNAELLEVRLKEAGAFPDITAEERARAYAPTPVSSCLLGLLNHSYMHFGQYLALVKPL